MPLQCSCLLGLLLLLVRADFKPLLCAAVFFVWLWQHGASFKGGEDKRPRVALRRLRELLSPFHESATSEREVMLPQPDEKNRCAKQRFEISPHEEEEQAEETATL